MIINTPIFSRKCSILYSDYYATQEQLDSMLEVLSILQKQGTGNIPGQACIH